MEYCQKCGKEIKDDADVCSYCGEKVGGQLTKTDSILPDVIHFSYEVQFADTMSLIFRAEKPGFENFVAILKEKIQSSNADPKVIKKIKLKVKDLGDSMECRFKERHRVRTQKKGEIVKLCFFEVFRDYKYRVRLTSREYDVFDVTFCHCTAKRVKEV